MSDEMSEWDLKKKCKELEKHNGWTNYETWVARLWIDSDEFTQSRAQELGKESLKNAPHDENVKNKIWTVCETAKFRLSEQLKEQFENDNPLLDKEASLYSDLMNASLGNVNWDEVAESYLPESCVRELKRKKRK